MKTLTVIVCLALVALLMWIGAAYSQSSACGVKAAMTKTLKDSYGETLLLSGKTTQGNTMTIFFNARTKTWTAAMESNATMCLVTSGKGMEFAGKFKGDEL